MVGRFKKVSILTIVLLCVGYIITHRYFLSLDNDIYVFNLTVSCHNCTEESMRDLIAYGRNHTFRKGIPRIVHYNYKSRLVPDQYLALIKQCVAMNQGVRFVIWSDVTSFYLIRDYFPAYFHIFRSYLRKESHPLKQSDLIRYFILAYFGGVYMDLDTRCQRPLEVALDQYTCVLSREAEVQTRILFGRQFHAMNSFMGCIPDHRFFNALIDNIGWDNSDGPIILTGPTFLTDFYENYNQSLSSRDVLDPRKYVSLAPSDLFSPFIEGNLHVFCKNLWLKWKIEGCNNLSSYRSLYKAKMDQAVVMHLFYHLGYDDHKSKIKQLSDISAINGMYVVV